MEGCKVRHGVERRIEKHHSLREEDNGFNEMTTERDSGAVYLAADPVIQFLSMSWR